MDDPRDLRRAAGLHDGMGAQRIGLCEQHGGVERPVNMALGGGMDDEVAFVHQADTEGIVADVADCELDALRLDQRKQIVDVGRVGHLVEHDDLRLREGVAHLFDDMRADEAGAASDKYFTHRAASAPRMYSRIADQTRPQARKPRSTCSCQERTRRGRDGLLIPGDPVHSHP